MAFYDQDHVITAVGVIIWDGITSPDAIVRDGQNTGKFNHNLRIAVPAGAPENAELQKLVEQTLAASTVQGVNLQSRGNNPISDIDLSKFPELPGHVCFTAGTQLGAPPVVDANGKELQAMQYGKMLYNGAKVKLLVHAYPYNNKQKGVNFGLDGIQIVDATAPRLAIGSAGMNAQQVAGAFGGGSRTAPPVEANHQQQQQESGQYHGYTQPGSSDAPPAPPTDDAPPPAPVEWPPEGWKPNPANPAWWYNTATKEQLKEVDLRARVGA